MHHVEVKIQTNVTQTLTGLDSFYLNIYIPDVAVGLSPTLSSLPWNCDILPPSLGCNPANPYDSGWDISFDNDTGAGNYIVDIYCKPDEFGEFGAIWDNLADNVKVDEFFLVFENVTLPDPDAATNKRYLFAQIRSSTASDPDNLTLTTGVTLDNPN